MTQHQHGAMGLNGGGGSSGGFVENLFVSDFTPRAECMNRLPEVIWLHVVSDAVIAAAYYSIPVALVYFVARRRDLAYPWMWVLFALFILACGTTHVFDVVAIWSPFYRFDGLVKAATAVLSIVTAATLWPLIPKALAIPSPTQLRLLNESLRTENEIRRTAELELERAHKDLEQRVADRTQELSAAVEGLRAENTQRRLAEERQRLAMHELDHRVKNTLATVLSLAENTGTGTEDVKQFLSSFTGRLRGLASLHESLAQRHWAGASLKQLLDRTVQPFVGDEPERVTFAGVDLLLSTREAGAISTVLCELATNAAKYGSLTVPAGKVRLDVSVEAPGTPGRGGTRSTVTMRWQESGGPAVRPPTRRGFGTELIERIVPYELKGKPEFRYEPTGVVCTVTWSSIAIVQRQD
jgi:two-component sensor histidine kinase